MQRLRVPLLLSLSALLLAGSAAASWQDLTPADFSMAPPPAPGSPESDADYARLLQLQASRTPDECSAAAAEVTPDFQSLFGNSGIMSKAELAAVAPFIDEASKLAAKISGYFKKKYPRPRPYDADARVQPCIPKPGGATSYPSTHATDGVVDACVLARLFPKRANILASYGRHVGDLRVISGVHHPSDVAAGQALGDQICARLSKEADFQAELAQVKTTLP
jgi:hypothetical protein